MPELPEVEVVRRGLEPGLTGRTLASVAVAHPRAVRRHLAGPGDFAARLSGRRLGRPRRRGKYLWVPLEPDGGEAGGDADDARGEALLAHLGMSGQLLLRPPEAPEEPHLRVRLTLVDGGPELRFVDQRTFGGLAVVPVGADGLPLVLAHLARDPLDPAFDEGGFLDALGRRRTGIKRALLDQTLVSGIGNIYADEALWRARLHAEVATDALDRGGAARVLAGARAVMGEALARGGTSFDALYVDVNGRSGRFEGSLAVYGRAGSPCRRCGTPVRRDRFMNRSSFSCPTCQPPPWTPGPAAGPAGAGSAAGGASGGEPGSGAAHVLRSPQPGRQIR